jgi:pre-mRNA-splicing factor SYF1
MAELERQALAPQGFVPASSGPEGGSVPKMDQAHVTINPDAIDLDITDVVS